MKQIPVKLGPLALLLAVISICLTTLAILTFTTSRADMRLAEKYAQTVQTRYELEIQGQEFVQGIAGGDLQGLTPDGDGILWKTIEKDGALLRIGITPEGRIVSWRQEMQWQQDTDMGNLWNGM